MGIYSQIKVVDFPQYCGPAWMKEKNSIDTNTTNGHFFSLKYIPRIIGRIGHAKVNSWELTMIYLL